MLLASILLSFATAQAEDQEFDELLRQQKQSAQKVQQLYQQLEKQLDARIQGSKGSSASGSDTINPSAQVNKLSKRATLGGLSVEDHGGGTADQSTSRLPARDMLGGMSASDKGKLLQQLKQLQETINSRNKNLEELSK